MVRRGYPESPKAAARPKTTIVRAEKRALPPKIPVLMPTFVCDPRNWVTHQVSGRSPQFPLGLTAPGDSALCGRKARRRACLLGAEHGAPPAYSNAVQLRLCEKFVRHLKV